MQEYEFTGGEEREISPRQREFDSVAPEVSGVCEEQLTLDCQGRDSGEGHWIARGGC